MREPKAGSHPSVERRPRTPFFTDTYSLYPSWRIHRLEMHDRFGWHEIAPEKLKDIRSKLGEFEQKTWRQILVDEKHRNHSVAIGDLIPEIQRRLTERQLFLEDLISLRLSGRERIWGYFSQLGAMEVLWWDPEHEICPSPKKRT